MTARAVTAHDVRRDALLVEVTGVIQGVGFRPFVHRLALRYGLDGWVRNRAGDVQIALEGARELLDAFLRDLEREAPPLARIEQVRSTPEPARGIEGFRVLESADLPGRRQPVPADVAMCDPCERELYDPTNRRYRFPFITCTDCGPRYSVIEGIPYDRSRTSMRVFRQCAECAREYDTPGDRRYHSETNSCPACGPRLWFQLALPRGHGIIQIDDDALLTAAAYLRGGAVVALRGMGGFHLACDATNEDAVCRLRERKRRDEKPLAVMVRTVADARLVAEIDEAEAEWLGARERPVVLLRRRADAALAPSVAPGLATVGVMLAYTPLHHLLLDVVRRPLVMTSGNLSEEPIAALVDEAIARLTGIADAFLLHDREILARIDDSVVRVAASAPIWLRRARGYAPLPLALPVATPAPLVAVGPHLKNTFTLAAGAVAYVSPHVGDLDNLETLEHFSAALASYERLFRIQPEVALCDLHPGYVSTRVADELGLPRVIAVQHHHAHIAAVMAEHGVTAPVIGVAYDGTGLGTDGAVWGAEILRADLTGFERLAQLRYAPLPGADLAIRQPWRAALGYLTLEPALAPHFAQAFKDVGEPERVVAERQAARGVNAPLASSIGRLFDAAAAILGVRRRTRYEGQAAMELESLAGTRPATPLPFPAERVGGRWVLDPLPLLAALGDRRNAGADLGELAAVFHESVAAGTADLVARLAADVAIDTVALGGGVFQNARLFSSLRERLEARRLRVLVPRHLSPNDGAISYGQAAIGAAILRSEVDGGSARQGEERCA